MDIMGSCGGIAHAGQVPYQRSMWFDTGKNLFVGFPDLQNFIVSFNVMIPSSLSPSLGSPILSHDFVTNSEGWLFQTRLGNVTFYIPQGALTVSYANYFNKYISVVIGKTPTSLLVSLDGITSSKSITNAVIPYNSHVFRVGSRMSSSLFLVGVVRDITIESSGLIASYIGDGIGADNWRDVSGNGLDMTLNGSPDPAYIRGDGKIIVNGEIKNP